MMKRAIAATALLVLLLSVTAACGDDQGQASVPESEHSSSTWQQEESESALNTQEEALPEGNQEETASESEEPSANPEEDEAEASEPASKLSSISSSQAALSIQSGDNVSVTESGSFQAAEGQVLHLEVTSDITGGTVDLFLFNPEGEEIRYTFSGSNQSEDIVLSEGTWAFNCTGFFKSGSISIAGTITA